MLFCFLRDMQGPIGYCLEQSSDALRRARLPIVNSFKYPDRHRLSTVYKLFDSTILRASSRHLPNFLHLVSNQSTRDPLFASYFCTRFECQRIRQVRRCTAFNITKIIGRHRKSELREFADILSFVSSNKMALDEGVYGRKFANGLHRT